MLCVRKLKLVQFHREGSITWRTPQYRLFGRTRTWRIQVGTPRIPQVVSPSPLKLFRRRKNLSVSDLVSPTWCEVKFDYGLRGKSSKPVAKRPKSFVSSSGKKISVEKPIAEKYEVLKVQGREVHKKLEVEARVASRKIRKIEPKVVEISSEGTKWALRLVSMLECLKCMLVDGYTVYLSICKKRDVAHLAYDKREMPVFGIVDDMVISGSVDEIIQLPILAVRPKIGSRKSEKAQRKAQRRAQRKARRKAHREFLGRAQIGSMSPQNVISSSLEIREKVLEPPNCGEGTEAEESTCSTSGVNSPTMLYLKDNKTRPYPSIPPHHDTLSGRLQLMLYRRLLSQLVSKSPLYDFNPLWKRLGVNSSSRLPKKFLVQANLTSDNSDFHPTTLDDVVSSWHEFVKEANIQGVNEYLELVYRLRPTEQKSKANTINPPKDLPPFLIDASENSTVGSSNHMEDSATVSEGLGEGERPSMMPLADKKVLKESSKKEDIRRFNIVGRIEFLHDDKTLDAHLTHILKWWRGERKPVGVPLELAWRCKACEYINDCEWRLQNLVDRTGEKCEEKSENEEIQGVSWSGVVISPPASSI